MDARSRRKLEMAANAAEFSRSHPDESPGYQAVLSGLDEEAGRRPRTALADQRSGILACAPTRPGSWSCGARCARRTWPISLRWREQAGSEAPEVPHEFVFKPGTNTHVAFQTTARGFLTQAEARRELLVRHGLVESVLTELRQSLDQFDAAMVSSGEARAAHVRASAELRRLANEVVQAVRVLDRFNRVRFRDTPEVLAAWLSVSNVVADSAEEGA